eukprot:TRINITY_DN4862_c2_g1_i2.p1 TRINITY_DN4862_c2_g1~~TRINITY_DN4862_c2_g1_i2.p1  ORF type:complete len:429 (+),score=43.63 TRINITY_DN4862_c2_g1_i2:405-1691(+)
MSSVLLLLCLCTILISVGGELTLMDTNGMVHEFDIMPVRFYDETTGEFKVDPFFFNGSIANNEAEADGKLLIISYHYGIDEKLRELEGQVMAIIMGTTRLSFIGRARYQLSEPRRSVNGVAVQVTNEDQAIINEFIDNKTVVWVSIRGDNNFTNPYEQAMLNIGTLTQVVLSLFFGCILSICIYLFIFELEGELDDALSRHRIILLIALIIANTFRFGFVAYDPYSYQSLSAWPINSYIHLINIPLSIVTEMIVSLLWFKTLNLTLFKNNRFLMAMRLPFIISATLFTVVLAVMIFLTVFVPRVMESLLFVAAFVYVPSMIALATYHLVVSIVFFKQVDKIKKKAAKKKNNKSFIWKVIVMSCCDILMIVFIVMMFIRISVTTTILNLFGMIAASGLHSCAILTLFSWKGGRTSSSKSKTSFSKTHQK